MDIPRQVATTILGAVIDSRMPLDDAFNAVPDSMLVRSRGPI